MRDTIARTWNVWQRFGVKARCLNCYEVASHSIRSFLVYITEQLQCSISLIELSGYYSRSPSIFIEVTLISHRFVFWFKKRVEPSLVQGSLVGGVRWHSFQVTSIKKAFLRRHKVDIAHVACCEVLNALHVLPSLWYRVAQASWRCTEMFFGKSFFSTTMFPRILSLNSGLAMSHTKRLNLRASVRICTAFEGSISWFIYWK